MKLYQVDYSDVDFNCLDGFDDRTVFQSKQWLDFLADAGGLFKVATELEGDEMAQGIVREVKTFVHHVAVDAEQRALLRFHHGSVGFLPLVL